MIRPISVKRKSTIPPSVIFNNCYFDLLCQTRSIGASFATQSERKCSDFSKQSGSLPDSRSGGPHPGVPLSCRQLTEGASAPTPFVPWWGDCCRFGADDSRPIGAFGATR
jgi:hypothetical protein